MKTIFKNGAYERVSDEVAETRVKSQGWKFVSKTEWKTNARPAVTVKNTVEAEKKDETLSKKAERRKKLKEKQRPPAAIDSLMKR